MILHNLHMFGRKKQKNIRRKMKKSIKKNAPYKRRAACAKKPIFWDSFPAPLQKDNVFDILLRTKRRIDDLLRR